MVPAAFAGLVVLLLVRDQGGYFPPSWGWSALVLLGVFVTWTLAGTTTDAGRLDAGFIVALLLLTTWVGLSIAWSVNRAQSVLELERGLVLLAGCTAFLMLARRRLLTSLVTAVLVSITGLCTYSLSTRLLPTAATFRPQDPVSGYRLFEPVGYWNALALFAVLGVMLALALVTEPTVSTPTRMLAAGGLVLLPVTLFFTFSRGAWLSLAVGLLVAFAASPQRLRFVLQGAVFTLAPGAAVLLASHAGSLTDQNATLVAARADGHRLALALAALVAASAALVLLVRRLERQARLAAGPRLVLSVALLVAVVAALAVGLARGGGPVEEGKRAYRSFVEPTPPPETANLTGRLLNLNGNGRAQLWSVAVESLHGHWLGGTGAGSFERNWDRSVKANEVVRDAHGLYVETLSELGAIGLVLLVTVLAIPLVAGLRARAVPLVPVLAGGYAAFLVHAGVDWDWEVAGVALTGLFVGSLLLVARRAEEERVVVAPLRLAGAAGGLAAAGFAFLGLAGNSALASAQSANRAHRYADAAAAASVARRWMPWSPEPLKAQGEARLEQGDAPAARTSFLAAISVDPRDWQSWLDLAASVEGAERRRAVARARALYPKGPEIVEFEEVVRATSKSRDALRETIGEQ